jgi:low affinity Fe/Cu permease
LLAVALITGLVVGVALGWLSPRWWQSIYYIDLLVLLAVQHTERHQRRAMHLKLDELLRSVEGARTTLVTVEQEPEPVLEALRASC